MAQANLSRKDVVVITLERMTGETPLEHHKRIVYGKLVDKTLADCDYTELAEVVYGQPYSSDVARRLFYGSRKTLELMDAERESKLEAEGDGSLIAELDRKKVELEKERQRYYDQRREYAKQVRSDGRWEHLVGVLERAATDLPLEVGQMFADGYAPEGFSDAEAVLVFTDWHYGMTAANSFNTYDTKICRERVEHVVRKAIERITLYECKRLHVVVLGDLIHGAIHTSARVAAEELVADQLIHVSEILAQAIDVLSQFVTQTQVYVTYGNHGRTVANKKDNLHRDNLERLIPWWLQQRFSQRQDVIVMPESDTEFLHLSVCGHEFVAVHGDLDSVQSSPRLLHTLFAKKYGADIEYVILGDRHHRESYEELGITSLLCGSLCGSDDFANDHRLFSSPSQLLLIVTRSEGVDGEYRIGC